MSDDPTGEQERPSEAEPEKYVPTMPPDARLAVEQFSRDWPKLLSALGPNWQKQVEGLSQTNTARLIRDVQKTLGPRFDDPAFQQSIRLAGDVQRQWSKTFPRSTFLPQIDEAVKNMQRVYVDSISSLVAKTLPQIDLSRLSLHASNEGRS